MFVPGDPYDYRDARFQPPEPRRWQCWMCHELVERDEIASIDHHDEVVCNDCARLEAEAA